MSYTFLQEQGAESSAESFSDIPASVLLRLNLTAGKFSCNGSATESCRTSQSGTISEPSTENPGADSSISCAADSHAKTFQQPEKERESTGSEADCGPKWPEWFAKWDRVTCSWKTRQCSLLAGLDEFSVTWPRWGMMQDGASWELTPPDFRIIEPDSGWLPTPSGVNGGKNNTMGRIDEWGGSSNPLRGTVIGYLCLPEFEEIVMGWPIGWTAPTPYATDKFQRWLDSHGIR